MDSDSENTIDEMYCFAKKVIDSKEEQGPKPTKKPSINLPGTIDPEELWQHATETGPVTSSSKSPLKRTSIETSILTPYFESNITITHHSPLESEWIRKLNGIVIHST